MSSKKALKIEYIGYRPPTFPTAAAAGLSRRSSAWLTNYGFALLSVYLTLKVWWAIVPSYPILFWAWMLIIPLGIAEWATNTKPGCLALGLYAGGIAWVCDIFCGSIFDA